VFNICQPAEIICTSFMRNGAHIFLSAIGSDPTPVISPSRDLFQLFYGLLQFWLQPDRWLLSHEEFVPIPFLFDPL
jgi:hypothetical protein